MAKPTNELQPDLFHPVEAGATKAKAVKKKSSANQTKPTCTKCYDAFLSVHQVAACYHVWPSTIWRWLKKAPDFPDPLKLTPGTTRWRLSDLVSYEAQCARWPMSKALSNMNGI